MSRTNHYSPIIGMAMLLGPILAWWFGGLDLFLDTGQINMIFCSVIVITGVSFFFLAFKVPRMSWVGASNCLDMGLFGTVIGLIMALPNIGDIEQATAGISLALWTTATGLLFSNILTNHGYALGLDDES